ncbi:hypothetical protein AAVH_40479, partial [Aphelenchoides avenae]
MSKEPLQLGQHDDVDFGILTRMLSFTGVYYSRSRHGPTFIKAVKVFRALVLCLSTAYFTGYYLFWHVIPSPGGMVFSMSLMTFAWIFQSTVAMFFLVYWQWKGQLQRLLRHIKELSHNGKERSYEENAKIARVIRITAFCIIGLIVQAGVLTIAASVLPLMGIKNDALIDFTTANPYYFKPLFVIGAISVWHVFSTWCVVLCLYISMSLILNDALSKFNEDLEQLVESAEPEMLSVNGKLPQNIHSALANGIGHVLKETLNMAPVDRSALADVLMEKYKIHTSLAQAVRAANETFE